MSEERFTDDELEAMADQAEYDTRMLEKIPALVEEVRRLRAEGADSVSEGRLQAIEIFAKHAAQQTAPLSGDEWETRVIQKMAGEYMPALVEEVRRLRAENERYRRELVFPVEGER